MGVYIDYLNDVCNVAYRGQQDSSASPVPEGLQHAVQIRGRTSRNDPLEEAERLPACLYGLAQYGIAWYGTVWYGTVWYGTVWYGEVRYGIVSRTNAATGRVDRNWTKSGGKAP